MIKVKEYRRGNLVELLTLGERLLMRSGFLMKISSVNVFSVEVIDLDRPEACQVPKKIEPKKLSPVIINYQNIELSKFNVKNNYKYKKISLSIGFEHVKVFYKGVYLLDVCYFHELQNICYCLLKEEIL